MAAQLRHAIFWQRPLRPVERGRCTFVPSEARLPKALPSVEERTIYEALNHLRYGEGVTRDRLLTKEQRDLVATALIQGKTGRSVSFDSLRAGLKLGSNVRFSIEDGGKSGLDDYCSRSAKELSNRKRFGQRWHMLPLQERDAIVTRLIEDEDESGIMAWLTSTYGLEEEAAEAIARWTPRNGVSRLGKTANAAVLEELKREVIKYDDAVRIAGKKLGLSWHHSDFREGLIQLPLPYYGQVLERQVSFGSGNPEDKPEVRYGRLTNPTAHIALGQLRRVVNKLVSAFGEPTQIVVELARDLKLNEAQKERARRENLANRRANDQRRQELEKLRIPDTAENRLRLRLFEEQQRANGGIAVCPYSLKPIGIEALFSSAIEIDHILPYSRTLDDTLANRILCYREANRGKRRQSPYEWLAGSKNWGAIVAAAAGLPANKRWRFAPDAMERFEKAERNFLARQINETRYLSRLARLYLGAATGTTDQVYVTTGQLTSLLRAHFGLNSILRSHNQEKIEGQKNRNDHRHHAVDACVIGAIDRSLLQTLTRLAGQAEEEERSDIVKHAKAEPFAGFRDAVRDKVNAITVSVKPEHGKGGALHEDTAYGLVTNPEEAAEIGNLVFRKPLIDLNANEIDSVRDPNLRRQLQVLAAPFRNEKGKLVDEKGLKVALAGFSIEETHAGETIRRKLRRIRIGKAKSGEVYIKNKAGTVYKALLPGENHHIDIVQMRDGSWKAFPATVFDVNQKGWRPRWEREKLGGKLVMRVHKGDMIEVNDADGQRRVKTVHRLSPSNNVLYLASHNEGGKLGEGGAICSDVSSRSPVRGAA